MTENSVNNINIHQNSNPIWGNISCVSLGPGDPQLITLKAWKILQQADIIYCPATRAGEKNISRANDILLELGIQSVKINLFCVPMSKERTMAQKVYSDIAKEIKQHAESGKRVSFVSEGDSGFYSSVHYISDYLLEMGVPVQHIAGVPAFIACGALAGIHIVKQDESLLVIPSRASLQEITDALAQNKTVVLMKLSQQKQIIEELITTYPIVQLHYFENVGIANKEYYTNNYRDIISREIPYFSILIIRKKDSQTR